MGPIRVLRHSTQHTAKPSPGEPVPFFWKHSLVGNIKSEERGEIANLMDLISQAGFLPVSGLCRTREIAILSVPWSNGPFMEPRSLLLNVGFYLN